MLQNLVSGSVLVALTVLIHTGGLILIAAVTPPLARWFGFHNHDIGRTLVMTGTVLGILAILTVEIWSWALAYVWLGATPDFGDALYLCSAMVSTIGDREIAIAPAWRLIPAREAINGVLMSGGCTAYPVGAATKHGPFRRGD